jgi:hypothetical protein
MTTAVRGDQMEVAEKGMLAAALWTMSDGGGNPIADDLTIDAFDPQTRAELRGDLHAFVMANVDDIAESGLSSEQIGHDFWMTRQHHGVGFWDRGLGSVGSRLTEACHPFGEVYLERSENNVVYSV